MKFLLLLLILSPSLSDRDLDRDRDRFRGRDRDWERDRDGYRYRDRIRHYPEPYPAYAYPTYPAYPTYGSYYYPPFSTVGCVTCYQTTFYDWDSLVRHARRKGYSGYFTPFTSECQASYVFQPLCGYDGRMYLNGEHARCHGGRIKKWGYC